MRYMQAKRPRKGATVTMEKTYMPSLPSISSSIHGMQLKSRPGIPIVK